MLNTNQNYSMGEQGSAVDVFMEQQNSFLKLRREEEMADQIDAFGLSVAKLRDEAVAYRKNSGIEEVWRKCEEAYLGIDDANRHEFEGQSWAKPMTMDSPLSRDVRGGNREAPKSTVFVKITSRYVDASAARLGDILMPVDDKPFTVDPTPVPELEEAKEDGTPVSSMMNGQPVPNPENPQMPLTVADVAQKQIQIAADKAKKAEKRIWDWQAECNIGGEYRKVIHDAARLGVGVLKGPIPMSRTLRKVSSESGQIAMSFSKAIAPGSVWVDPWNLYPDPACGENIHDGSFLWEHDTMSAKQLQDLKDQPGYLASQIKKILKEGPGKRNSLGAKTYGDNDAATKHQYDIWHFYGEVSTKDLGMVGAVGVEDLDESCEKVSAILTMVNDSVIRATLNPMESGCFPYDTMAWKRRAGNWAGVGVAEDLFAPQRMVNGATRAMLDNGGLSAGAQVVVDKGAIYPADGSWVITPNKIWNKAEESPTSDVRQAFTTFTIPSAQAELMNIIQFGLRSAEEAAGLPLVAQGQSSNNKTYGQDQLQQNNANTLLRRVGKAFDDGITTPHINRYYEWLMMDPSVPDDEKGDYTMVVHGSAALIERAIQDESLMAMGQMSMNPSFGIDPKKWFAEMCRSKFMDPKRLQFTEEEMAEQQKTQQPPPMPQIEVAKIRADVDMKKLQAGMAQSEKEMQLEREIAQREAEIDQFRIQKDMDRDTIYVQSEQQRNASEHQSRMSELSMKLELAKLAYAEKHSLKLEEVKAKLAETAMKLNVTKELAGASHEMDIHRHMTPPAKAVIEPPGRAANGQSFSQ